MFPFPFEAHGTQQIPESTQAASESIPRDLSWQRLTDFQGETQRRLDAMEQDEPKRHLICNAETLRKQRKITQAQMAEEIGVPRRTLEEWLQFRRMPKAPGATLIQRWVAQQQYRFHDI